MKTKSSTPPHKKPWYLITGFFLGIVLGLIISWWVFPVEYVDTPPSSLREDLKDEYRVMIALSYAINRDLERAKLRLQLLDGEETVTQTTLLPTSAYQLAIQAQKALADGRVETEAQALGLLAAALGQKPSPYPSPTTQPSPSKTYTPAITSFPTTLHTITATTTFTATVSTPGQVSHTNTPLPASGTAQATFSLLPSRTPTSTMPPLFSLQSRKLICDPALKQPMLQVQVVNAQGTPLSGVNIIIQWDGGQDTFTTGLKPDRGAGYADYLLKPNTNYTLLVGEGGLRIGDIQVENCETSRQEKYGGTWLYTFHQVP